MKRHVKSGLALVVAVLLFVVSGCSGSGTPAKSDQGGSKAPADSGAKEVKIGLEYPLTGAWAVNGINSRNGALLAIDIINERGGIKSMGGAKLVPVVADSGNDPSNAANVARRLINDEKVQAITCCYTSSFTLTVTTEAERARVPVVTQSYVDELVQRGYKYTIKTTPFGTLIGSAAVKYTKEMIDDAKADVKKVAVFSSSDAAHTAQYNGAVDQAKQVGFDLVDQTLYPVGLTDATTIVSKLKSSGAQMLFIGGPLTEVMLIIRTMRSAGINIPIVGLGGGGMLTAEFPKNLGAASDGVLSTGSWNWDISEDAKMIAERYVQKFKEPFMPQEAGSAFIEVYVAYLGMEKAGTTDSEKVRAAILALDTTEFPATLYLGKRIGFTEQGMTKHSYPVFIEYKDGKPRSVWPKEVQQMKPSFGK